MRLADGFYKSTNVTLIGLENDLLRVIGVIKLLKPAPVEGHGAERVHGDAPRHERVQRRPEARPGDGQHGEQEHRVVVRKAIPELNPARILVKKAR